MNSDCSFKPCSTLKEVIQDSDLITVHIPMNKRNENFIDRSFLRSMKLNSFLINTSRGGILNESHLYEILLGDSYHLAGVALDVFKDEPYNGALKKFNNVLLTPHVGSLTLETRIKMETQAVEECIAFSQSKSYINLIPELKVKVEYA